MTGLESNQSPSETTKGVDCRVSPPLATSHLCRAYQSVFCRYDKLLSAKVGQFYSQLVTGYPRGTVNFGRKAGISLLDQSLKAHTAAKLMPFPKPQPAQQRRHTGRSRLDGLSFRACVLECGAVAPLWLGRAVTHLMPTRLKQRSELRLQVIDSLPRHC